LLTPMGVLGLCPNDEQYSIRPNNAQTNAQIKPLIWAFVIGAKRKPRR
jgi:hypothetical protein